MPIAANVPAASWTVRPEITLRETYTDNAFIGQGPPRTDWVTEVTPSIRIDGRSPRLTANLSYAPSAVFYARNNEFNDVINNLDAFGRLEAVERFFFVEAAAKINQNFITPLRPSPGTSPSPAQPPRNPHLLGQPVCSSRRKRPGVRVA